MHEIPALAACGGVCAAGGTFAWAAVAPSSELFGATIRKTGNDSTIALTFDDGPNPAVTPGLLDSCWIVTECKATFFLIGEWVRAVPLLVAEIASRGHTVGNHTNSHPALTFLSPTRIAEELKRCDDAIEAATRHKPRWVRPPFGFRSPLLGAIVRKRGDRGVVMWSRWAQDWKPQPVGARNQAVARRTRRRYCPSA